MEGQTDFEKINSVKKILIFTPTLGLNPNPYEYQASLISVFHQIQACNLGLSYFPTYRQLWHQANNMAWNVAFENGFDYILRIDDDIHGIPQNAVKKLVEANKDVIGAAYPNRRWPFMTAAMNRTKQISLMEIWANDDKCLQYVYPDPLKPEEQVVKCELVGFGMTLIKTEKFKFLKRPLYLGNEDCPDDTFFAQICMDEGIEQHVNFGVPVEHAHVNYFNNGFLFNAGVFEILEGRKREALTKMSLEEYEKIKQQDMNDIFKNEQLVSHVADK